MLRHFYSKVMAAKSLIFSSEESYFELFYRNFLLWLKGRLSYNLLHMHIFCDIWGYCLHSVLYVKEFLMCTFTLKHQTLLTSRTFQMWNTFHTWLHIWSMKVHNFIYEYREKREGRATDHLYGPQNYFDSKTNALWKDCSGKLVRQISSTNSIGQNRLYSKPLMVK